MIVIYEASCSSDSTEGRGPKHILGFFKHEEDALECVKGKGPMGKSDGDVREVFLFASYKEYEKHENGDLRRSALAKLNKAERLALGLKEEWLKLP